MKLALHVMRYLKKYPNKRIVIDSRPLVVDDKLKLTAFHPKFLEDYGYADEEIPNNIPAPHGPELETSIFWDADHAHDVKTRRSVTGLILFVGSTPIAASSRCQSCIATSTYCAEFIAMRCAVEEAISLRYMLRCLGIPIKKGLPINLYGDNWSVIQSANVPNSEMRKKHIAVSYHFVREAITAKIINPMWVRLHENLSDVCTKPLGSCDFKDLVEALMA